MYTKTPFTSNDILRFTFDDANQLVSSTCDGVTTRYEYDAAGRLVKEGNRTYTYGYLDKVMSVAEGDKAFNYIYHPDGWNALAYCKNDSCNCIDFSGAFARCRYVISTKVLTVFDETTNQAFWTYAKSGNNDPSKQWEQMGPLPVGTWDIIAYGDDLYFQLWYEDDASLDDIATNSVTGQHRDWIRLTINSESHGCICMYPDRDSSWDIMSTLKATEYKWRVNGSENTALKYRWYGVIEVVE